MAQYKIKKDYIVYICTESLSKILEQREKLKQSKKWYHWCFKPFKTNMEIDFYRWRDSCFCEEHLTACLMTSGNFVIINESECYKLNNLWKEFIYEKK